MYMPKAKITWLGLRAFPGVQGGVETHAENLCPLLVGAGYEVEVITRSPYHRSEFASGWKGVSFRKIWAPKNRQLETLLHTFLGVLYAGLISRPDILHIHCVGPALLVPIAKLMGLRVVVTHHGPDYDREKWGGFGKLALKVGERLGMLFSDARIVISKVIDELVLNKYNRESYLIPNGVTMPPVVNTTDALDQFGLEAGRYIIFVGRLVPEKRHLDLISAFSKAGAKGWKLVIVGAADHQDSYALEVQEVVETTPNVVAAGFQSGTSLRELYGNAGLFVLPSAHEGLPIALLEALSYGLPVLASDIPANVAVGLPGANYFKLGDTDDLAKKMRAITAGESPAFSGDIARNFVCLNFDWASVASKTVAVYKGLLNV
jgi:glycosyltransferase involved in cell wall biosynthesis